MLLVCLAAWVIWCSWRSWGGVIQEKYEVHILSDVATRRFVARLRRFDQASTNASWSFLPYTAGPHFWRSRHMTRYLTSFLKAIPFGDLALLDSGRKVSMIKYILKS